MRRLASVTNALAFGACGESPPPAAPPPADDSVETPIVHSELTCAELLHAHGLECPDDWDCSAIEAQLLVKECLPDRDADPSRCPCDGGRFWIYPEVDLGMYCGASDPERGRISVCSPGGEPACVTQTGVELDPALCAGCRARLPTMAQLTGDRYEEVDIWSCADVARYYGTGAEKP